MKHETRNADRPYNHYSKTGFEVLGHFAPFTEDLKYSITVPPGSREKTFRLDWPFVLTTTASLPSLFLCQADLCAICHSLVSHNLFPLCWWCGLDGAGPFICRSSVFPTHHTTLSSTLYRNTALTHSLTPQCACKGLCLVSPFTIIRTRLDVPRSYQRVPSGFLWQFKQKRTHVVFSFPKNENEKNERRRVAMTRPPFHSKPIPPTPLAYVSSHIVMLFKGWSGLLPKPACRCSVKMGCFVQMSYYQ